MQRWIVLVYEDRIFAPPPKAIGPFSTRMEADRYVIDSNEAKTEIIQLFAP